MSSSVRLTPEAISIHAPAKGATPLPSMAIQPFVISIHAPAKGATLGGDKDIYKCNTFQSTLPRRERQLVEVYYKWDTIFQSTLPRRERHGGRGVDAEKGFISIHAPAKGATTQNTTALQRVYYFNPRSREGSDGCYQAFPITDRLFQSTLPRRERPDSSRCFGVRPAISIHAPAKGATVIASVPHSARLNFNPRSREGSDCKNHIFL